MSAPQQIEMKTTASTTPSTTSAPIPFNRVGCNSCYDQSGLCYCLCCLWLIHWPIVVIRFLVINIVQKIVVVMFFKQVGVATINFVATATQHQNRR